jgi:hypothetical protein
MSAVGDLGQHRDGLPIFSFDIDDVQLETALTRECFGEALRLVRIIDPAVDAQSLPPETATRTLSSWLNISYFLMKRSVCSGTHSR